MRIAFLLLVFYSVALFLCSFFLLDVESMMLNELRANPELEIPENVLLDALEDMRYWNRFSVVFTFLILLLKCFFIALVLYAGLFFTNLHQGIKVGKLFRVAVFSEVILVIGGILKVIMATMGDLTYSQFAVYTPGAVLSVVDQTALNPLMLYPLQVLNVFELLYCVLLVFFFRQEIGVPVGANYKVVLGSYGFMMAFWMVLILFLTLNFT